MSDFHFILSTAVEDGGTLTIYEENNKLFAICEKTQHVFDAPLTTLNDVLKFFQKRIPDSIQFVNMKTYQSYPKNFPQYCALRYLPEEGMYGILSTN